MFDLLPESRVDEFRDILSEIDAGELDEQYLIKHAGTMANRMRRIR